MTRKSGVLECLHDAHAEGRGGPAGGDRRSRCCGVRRRPGVRRWAAGAPAEVVLRSRRRPGRCRCRQPHTRAGNRAPATDCWCHRTSPTRQWHRTSTSVQEQSTPTSHSPRSAPTARSAYVNSNHSHVDLVADHLGTITTDSYTPANPDATPQRTIDTRIGTGGTTVAPGARVCFEVAGDPGDVAVVNLTPVLATGRATDCWCHRTSPSRQWHRTSTSVQERSTPTSHSPRSAPTARSATSTPTTATSTSSPTTSAQSPSTASRPPTPTPPPNAPSTPASASAGPQSHQVPGCASKSPATRATSLSSTSRRCWQQAPATGCWCRRTSPSRHWHRTSTSVPARSTPTSHSPRSAPTARSATSTPTTATSTSSPTTSARSTSTATPPPTPTPPPTHRRHPRLATRRVPQLPRQRATTRARPIHSGRSSGRISTGSGGTGRPPRTMKPRSTTRSS